MTPQRGIPFVGATARVLTSRHRSTTFHLMAGLFTISRTTILSSLLALALSVPGTTPAESPEEREFTHARPGYTYHFPFDHGSHDGFQTEWWYYTGHLKVHTGRTFGYQLTFFRRAVRHASAAANPSRWTLRQLYFAHFALTDEQQGSFHFAERISRAGIGKAGADATHLNVWIADWHAEMQGEAHLLRARNEDIAVALNLTPEKLPIVHGREGISRKGDAEGEASHYYSFTRLHTDGTITVDGHTFTVSGVSWMDHEFGSNQLGDVQEGWDWFSLQIDDGSELMVYRIRRRDGSLEPASGGTWIPRHGPAVPLNREAISIEILDHWTSPQSGGRYPSRWRLNVPSVHLAMEIRPTLAQQELVTQGSTQVTYWEGSVTATGTRDDRSVSALGYAELTGYATSLRKRL